MGWFWADSAPSAPAAPVAPHPMPQGAMQPPPECPMHNKMAPPPPPNPSTPAGACPYVPPEGKGKTSAPTTSPTTTEPEAPKQGLLSRLNPLNNMFADLSNDRAKTQTQALPLEREPSTIPKGDGSLWEYPSPQQMYNAMLRKGYTDTDVTAVESMVSVHNFLNEGAWAEIIGWERRFGHGLAEGFKICKRGEENANRMLDMEDPFDTTWKDESTPAPSLVRFTGRPTEMTPKAQMMQLLGRMMPEKFGTEPPFDRHDWFVRRCKTPDLCKEVRYVIDYYEGQDSEEGEPVFYLDVRPAIDGPTSAAERMVRWGTDVWWKATGGVVREVRLAEEARKKAEKEREKIEGETRKYNN